jgi:hypothetical protein
MREGGGVKVKQQIKHLSAIVILGLFLAYYFFFIGNYAAYPWWHQSLNDIDGTNAATTVGLLNNSDLQYVYHPGATVYFLHGLVYRFLAIFDSAQRTLFHLNSVTSIADADNILEIATRTSRVVTLIVAIVTAAVFYLVIYQITATISLSFLFAFYIATSEAFLQHTFMIRPEILSMLFVFIAGFLWLKVLKKYDLSLTSWGGLFVSTGFLIGFSVFSKIQSGPIIIALVGVILYRLAQINMQMPKRIPRTGFTQRICLYSSILNFILLPWWALKRPDFLTPTYIKGLRYHELYLYGPNPPANFYLLVFVTLLFLLALSIWMFVKPQQFSSKTAERLFPAVLFVNLVMTGLILSAYAILLPVSGSFSRYCENSRHLVYAVFTNILSGGIMQHKVIDSLTVPKIIEVHSRMSPLLKINGLFFVALTLVASLARIIRKTTAYKPRYMAVIAIFVMGFIMDVFSTLRSNKLYEYYTCYSVVFYGAGLALWTATEFRQKLVKVKGVNLNLVLHRTIVILLCLHIVFVTQQFLKKPRASGISDQTPIEEFRNTRTLAKPFWKIVDRNIESRRHQ